jgi:hypothetical protein
MANVKVMKPATGQTSPIATYAGDTEADAGSV